ncbi:MAG: VCBS repeat-containing protein [Paracoccaceae bacterium]|nr:VCBS repeat-containing protein [Paracoccaceae bacterium]
MLVRAALTAACLAGPALAEGVREARYADPTDRYAHGVLGDAIEHGALEIVTESGRRARIVLPNNRVFEDTAPRIYDVDGDGDHEVIVVEADNRLGARLSIYDAGGLVAANEFIGRRFRWLAPVGDGAADLDGDGAVEIAFVDRPHLRKTLRVFQFENGGLTPLAELPGVTNHRIGEPDIAGGIRDCGAGPEMIVATADWARVLAVAFDGAGFRKTDLGPHAGRETFARAMDCDL